jgi:hypothetical protein
MATQELLAQLGCWEGYEVEGCWEEQRGAQRWCVVRLRPVAGRERECSGCGERCTAIHDCEERRVRDLPIWSCPGFVDVWPLGFQAGSGTSSKVFGVERLA